jgi:uncharacterized Zn-binding protein involved in type VI secretion
MPAIAVCTVDKIATGHACTGVATIQGSLQTKVTIAGNPAAVQGDAIVPHTRLIGDECITHSASISGGSSKVSIGGIPVARIGDAADLGSIISGSSKIYAN